MRCILFVCCLLVSTLVYAQSFTTWIVGDAQDVSPSNFEFGIVLAGGGGDNDNAMQWMLNRADGGDVLVIRASQSDGYNDYFFSDLGVNVNSVRTIRFNDASASTDPFVLQEIQNAEILFIAGGDQFDYYSFWKDTPVEQAINDLINVKGITVGGTSAGMAILGDVYYTPNGGSLTSEQALANPFHPNVDILGEGDFVAAPFLNNVITDTHYDQRDRQPRHFTFIARMVDA
ncbi:MAG: cyanophycinase, partial [Bacteroidota bacterium]